MAEQKNLMDLRKHCAKDMLDKVNESSREKALNDNDKEEIRDLAMMILYDKTHDHFMAIASLAALRSEDPRTCIGACIVDTNNRVVGIGCNSMPDCTGSTATSSNNDHWNKTKLDGKEPYQIKENFVVHAAVNAIVNRTIPDLTGCTIYLTQHPDEDCAHLIAQSGIKKVIYWHPYPNRGTRDHEKKAMVILLLAEVCVEKYDPKTEVEIILDENEPLSLKKRLQDSEGVDADVDKVLNPNLVITSGDLFMGLAQLECLYSNEKDNRPNAKVGACIVNEREQVLAIGGSIGLTKDRETVQRMEELIPACASSITYTKDPIAQHAEYMAIASYKGIHTLRGCTLYVTTMPCDVCAKLIVQSGIKMVFYEKEFGGSDRETRKNITEEIIGGREKIMKLHAFTCRLKMVAKVQTSVLSCFTIAYVGISGERQNIKRIKLKKSEQVDEKISEWIQSDNIAISEDLLRIENTKTVNFCQFSKHTGTDYTTYKVITKENGDEVEGIRINTNIITQDPKWKDVAKGKGYFFKHYCAEIRYGTHDLIQVSNNAMNNLQTIQVTLRKVK